MKLTEKERDVLEAIRGWDGASIPTECLQNECEINPSSIPGVVSSLVKKGVVECWGTGSDATITITRDEAMTTSDNINTKLDRLCGEFADRGDHELCWAIRGLVDGWDQSFSPPETSENSVYRAAYRIFDQQYHRA